MRLCWTRLRNFIQTSTNPVCQLPTRSLTKTATHSTTRVLMMFKTQTPTIGKLKQIMEDELKFNLPKMSRLKDILTLTLNLPILLPIRITNTTTPWDPRPTIRILPFNRLMRVRNMFILRTSRLLINKRTIIHTNTTSLSTTSKVKINQIRTPR